MGIRFLCHHCERRLNVKATQAGQEGECPHCGTTVSIPEKSTIRSELEKANHPRRRPSHTGSDSVIGLLDTDQDPSVGLPSLNQNTETPTTPVAKPKLTGSATASKSSNWKSGSFELDKPGPPDSLGKVDPISEAPKRVWYFRSRELGERGPLRAKEMRIHVDQGDVTVGCIVWREDWEDWLPAEQAFPTLAAQAKQMKQQSRVDRAFKDANYKIPDEFNPHSELNRKRRFKNRMFIAAIAAGILTIAVLIFVLIKILAG